MNKRSGIESKKRIIDAAIAVFSAKGYAKANIREIAKSAGISVGGVYLYFKNKEELYKNLVNNWMRDIGSKSETTAASAKSASEALSDFLKMHLENALKHREFILLHIREHGFAFGAREKRKFFRSQQELVAQIIQSGIASGEFRKCNPEDMAMMIMGSLRGVLLSVALDDNIHVTPEMLREFMFLGLLTVSKRKLPYGTLQKRSGRTKI
jgi:AcrR family transcriptional regulator